MSSNTLKESTLRRLMELAGTLDYADEVILENKKVSKENVIKENAACAPKKVAEKKEKSDDKKDEKDSEKKEKNLMLDEAEDVEIEDEPDEMEPAPTGDSDLTDVPNVPPAPEDGVVEDDLTSFAAGLVDLLSQHFNRQVTMQIDGADVAPPVETEESFEAPVDDEPELPPTEEPAMPPSEPRYESKKKTAAEMVYQAIVEKLLKQSGVNTKEAKKNGSKIDIKFTPKKK